jgi:hypothetical protein
MTDSEIKHWLDSLSEESIRRMFHIDLEYLDDDEVKIIKDSILAMLIKIAQGVRINERYRLN